MYFDFEQKKVVIYWLNNNTFAFENTKKFS